MKELEIIEDLIHKAIFQINNKWYVRAISLLDSARERIKILILKEEQQKGQK